MRKIRHVIESQQWDREGLEELFSMTREMRDSRYHRYPKSRKHRECLFGYIMAALFYEESTRTRFSHEAAMLRLGGHVISTENALKFSSVSKGETLEDTIRNTGAYADVIVLRHFDQATAQRAATVSKVPVINAGDGPGQHPTQALLDVFTIEDELGGIDGKTIAFVGDLANGRTVRSLCYMLGKFEPAKVIFTAHELVRMKQDIKDYLDRHDVPWEEIPDLNEAARQADVLYVTRIQKERFTKQRALLRDVPGRILRDLWHRRMPDALTILDDLLHDGEAEYGKVFGQYIVNRDTLAHMKEKSIIMHPLPRKGEITVEVDDDPRAAYFRQAENGMYIRMALLQNILNEECH